MSEPTDDWKHCLQWIIRCNVLEEDHRLVKEGLQVFDFASTIRDGVILCYLLNALRPSTIDLRDFSQRPQMSQFLLSKNIRVFLSTCRNTFQMTEDQLFKVADLYDFKDFAKVIQSLSILSNTPEAKKSGIRGFQVGDNKDYYSLTASEHSNDDDYSKQEDKIYQDLCSIKKQESMREASIPVSSMTKREYCIRELIETETNYLNALQMMITSFMKPLATKLAADDWKTLFHGIETLHNIHMCFRQDLFKACNSRHGSIRQSTHVTISDCFVKYKEKFLNYGDYCSNLPKVQATLDRLQTNSAATQAILECQNEANGGKFRLRDLLSIPMQRVLKYHLLLKELIKNTDEFHPEKQGLQKALEEMHDLASYVNETKRDNENLQWIQDVQKSIVNLEKEIQFHIYGRLHKDGEMKAKTLSDKSERIYFFFLFDYMLFRCKARGNETYNLKEHYELNDFEMDDLNNCQTREKNKQFCFQMIHRERNESVLIFYPKTMEIKEKWLQLFKIASTNRNPPFAKTLRHDFIMTSFTEPTICDVCRKLLRGVFYQGYKCTNTNMVVHKDCIEKAKNISGPPVLPPKQAAGNKVKAISAYKGDPPPYDGRPPIFFEENDVFLVLSMDDSTWWMGRHLGKEGYFPKRNVILLRSRESTVGGDEMECPQTPFLSTIPALPKRFSKEIGAPPTPHVTSIQTPLPLSPGYDEWNNYPWFVGEMSRDEATKLLEGLPDSTFLVRISNSRERKGQLSLSIKYGTVKNVEIKKNSNSTLFYLSDETFSTLPDLIKHYKTFSLATCFEELPTNLKHAYKLSINNV